jgi:prepilin-type N-terminal cleavage/methylation domain-containing protein
MSERHQLIDRRGRLRDAGFTLPELVITMSVTAILLTAIAAALISMLRISTGATAQLSEAKDVVFVQTWMPVDLGSALVASDSPDNATMQAELAIQVGSLNNRAPSLDFLDGLSGTNVLTIIRPDTDGPSPYLVVSYRYEQAGPDWVLNRYEFRNPGSAAQSARVNRIATELMAPPVSTDPAVPTWTHGDDIDFAVSVSPKELGNRPVGRDVSLTFASRRTFTTGGAGLSAEQALPPADLQGLSDPIAPPSRCGKRVAIILDTSGSVPQGSGGASTEAAAIGFINGFVGTPTTISLNGFDRTGYGMAIDLAHPVTSGLRAPFYSVLNDSAVVDGMRLRVAALDDTDGQWRNGGSTISPGNPSNRRDPDRNGVYWGQVGDGTNWEGGLWNVFRSPAGALYASEQPDLVVFITDGQPNYVRNGTRAPVSINGPAAATAARKVADDLRGMIGARVVGVMVGNKSANSTYVGYLKDLTSGPEWDGGVNSDGTIDVGNAAEAGLFKGGFDDLGGILRSIVVGECGGTVTLQKRIDDGGSVTEPASGVWSYTSNEAGNIGTRDLDRANTSSVTFDYSFTGGVGSKSVQLTEQPVDGYAWVRGECTANGVAVPTAANADGTPGVTVTVGADEAVSCLMVSEPA